MQVVVARDVRTAVATTHGLAAITQHAETAPHAKKNIGDEKGHGAGMKAGMGGERGRIREQNAARAWPAWSHDH